MIFCRREKVGCEREVVIQTEKSVLVNFNLIFNNYWFR